MVRKVRISTIPHTWTGITAKNAVPHVQGRVILENGGLLLIFFGKILLAPTRSEDICNRFYLLDQQRDAFDAAVALLQGHSTLSISLPKCISRSASRNRDPRTYHSPLLPPLEASTLSSYAIHEDVDFASAQSPARCRLGDLT